MHIQSSVRNIDPPEQVVDTLNIPVIVGCVAGVSMMIREETQPMAGDFRRAGVFFVGNWSGPALVER